MQIKKTRGTTTTALPFEDTMNVVKTKWAYVAMHITRIHQQPMAKKETIRFQWHGYLKLEADPPIVASSALAVRGGYFVVASLRSVSIYDMRQAETLGKQSMGSPTKEPETFPFVDQIILEEDIVAIAMSL